MRQYSGISDEKLRRGWGSHFSHYFRISRRPPLKTRELRAGTGHFSSTTSQGWAEVGLGQADNVNYTRLANREDWAPNLNHPFSFSWNWTHFIENAQDWTYASSPGLQDWDNIRTARGGIVNLAYSESSATG